MNNNRNEIIILIIISLLGTISLTWFKGRSFLFGCDTVLPLNQSAIDEYFYAWTWSSAYSGADISKFSFLLPLGSFLKLFSLSNTLFSPSIFQKLLIYITFTFSGISTYFLLTTLRLKSPFARLFASLLYMFNFYFLWLWVSVSYLPLVYAFFPLILALYIKGVREGKDLPHAVIAALIWTVTVTPGYGKPFVAINWFIILSFFIFYVVSVRNKGKTKKALRFTFILTVVWFALNAIWIVPLFSSFHEELEAHAIPEVTPWALFEHNSVKIVDGIRLMGYYGLTTSYKGSPWFPWYGIYNSPLFIIISFFLPILAFSAFIVNKRNKDLTYFGILTIIFLFLVKGPNPPLGSVNTFLFSHFNLDFIFRSVYQRFMGYVVLGYVVLIAFTIDGLIKTESKKRSFAVLRGLLIMLVFAGLVGILPHPLWTGSLYDRSGIIPSIRVEIPSYYYEATDWIDAQQCDFNVLPLPFPINNKLPLLWDNGENGYRAKYPFTMLSSKRFITNDFGNQTASILVDLIVNGAINDSSVLNVFNVKYIIFHRDANWKYLEGISDAGQIQRSLDSMNGLVLEKSFGKIDIYRNTHWKPTHAYSLPSTSLDLLKKLGAEKSCYIYFVDDFESGSLSQWTSVKGDWKITTESKEGNFSVVGTDNSSRGLPFLELTRYKGKKISIKKFVAEGLFKFGENTLAHFPFWLRVESGKSFYPIIAERNGHFTFSDGRKISEFPIDKCYSPNRWYQIKTIYDIEEGKYWVWIDNELITPTGLPIYLYESKSMVPPQENFTTIRIYAGREGEVGATMWVDDVRIWDQESENLISQYAWVTNLVENSNVIELNKINPTYYRANIEATRPFILIFNEKHDKGWIAKVNGREYESFNAFGFANGYLIDRKGNLEITFEYKPQRWFTIGCTISLTTLLACTVYLTITYTKNKHLLEKLKKVGGSPY